MRERAPVPGVLKSGMPAETEMPARNELLEERIKVERDAFICVWIYINTFVYVCVPVYTYVCTLTHMFAWIRTHIFLYVCLFIYVFVHDQYVCVCVHIYTYIHV